MSTVAVTYTFVNGNPNDGPQVSQNFTDLTSYINTNCITKDAALAFTAVPSGPAVDASTPNQYVRKAMLDARVPTGWTAYTPTLDQGGAVAKTVVSARYMQMGKLVVAQISLAALVNGLGGNVITFGLPVAPKLANLVCGSGYVYDASANISYVGICQSYVGSTAGIIMAGTATYLGVAGMTAGLASGDAIVAQLSYEAL